MKSKKNTIEVGACWNQIADNWTILSEKGADICRDYVNMPAFLDFLPNVEGMHGIDVGCGNGDSTIKIAQRNSFMTGIDISYKFIKIAKRKEKSVRLGIKYVMCDSSKMPFPESSFDFAIAFMSLMDIFKIEETFYELKRILKRNAFFLISISHPCYDTNFWEWEFDENGMKRAGKLSGYFKDSFGEVEKWSFTTFKNSETIEFEVPRFRRTLSSWLNLLIQAGFKIDAVCEPYADNELIKKIPELACTKIVAYFLIIKCWKI